MTNNKFKKFIFIALVIFVGFFLIIFYLNWEFSKMAQKIQKTSGLSSFPKPENQGAFLPKGEEKIFVSSDEKMQFKYSDYWQETENGESSFPLLEISQQVKTFFLAQKTSFTSLGILTAGEILPGKREEVISKLKESFLGPQYQTIEKEKEIIFEDQPVSGFGFGYYFMAKIFGDEKEYIIIGIGFGGDLKGEIRKIIDSAEIKQ